MGELSLAAKITHVPSMYLSEMDGPHKGCRTAAIAGHKEISRRCRELGVDTIVVFDTHWLVNSGYHINNAAHFKGVYTSNELPHFIRNMPYEYDGNPQLGEMIADAVTAAGVRTRAHSDTTLALEYGTLVPMRYMNADRHFKVISISALCTVHDLADSAALGAALRQAIERDYDGKVAILASGSLSHRFAQNGVSDQYLHKVWSPFLEEFDHQVVEMWEQGNWQTFTDMLPEYAEKCHGEGFMHDTAMLLGALGWDEYQGKAEVLTPYFGSSGTGQINVVSRYSGMAHFIYEYSANLPRDLLDLEGLMAKMHQLAADSGVFPLSGIRSRAMCCEEFRVGDGNPGNGFVNLSIKVGRGRDEDTRHEIAEKFFSLMVDHLQPIFQRQGLAVSLEMRELEARVKFNHKNI